MLPRTVHTVMPNHSLFVKAELENVSEVHVGKVRGLVRGGARPASQKAGRDCGR